MTMIRESAIYRLCLWIAATYQASCLGRTIDGIGAWCARQIDESQILRPLCREGAVAKAWPDSFLCRVLMLLLNLPMQVVHRIYLWLQPTFDSSFFSRLAFQMGDETDIAQSWLIALLWVIPFAYWNNAYTLIGFLFLLVLFHAGAMRSARKLDLTAIGFYPLLMFGGVLLSVVFSCQRSSSTRFLIYHVSAALCVLVTVSAVRTGEELKRLAAGGSVCVLVSGLYGIYQRIQGVEVNPSYVDLKVNPDMPGRVESFFDNPNTFAEVLILLLPLVLALILCSKRFISKAMACGVFAVGVAALGMTYSRASWVGIAVAMAIMVFLWKPKLIPACIVLCFLAVPFIPTSILNRILTITNTKDTSTASRIPLRQAALGVIRMSPFSGAGLGTAAVQKYIKAHDLYHERAPFIHAHNFYLQIWVETGLLGIVGFVASMLWNIKRSAHIARHSGSSAARTLTCAAAASLCGAMVCGLADYLWNYPRVMCIFWFVFAMALSGVKVCQNEQAASEI